VAAAVLVGVAEDQHRQAGRDHYGDEEVEKVRQDGSLTETSWSAWSTDSRGFRATLKRVARTLRLSLSSDASEAKKLGRAPIASCWRRGSKMREGPLRQALLEVGTRTGGVFTGRGR
jgi:hypothetical protein